MGRRIEFAVPGEVKPASARKARSFLAKDDKTVIQGRMYEPKDRQEWKALCRLVAQAAMQGQALFEGPVTVRMMFLRPSPTSTPKKPCKSNWWPWAWWRKPDWENLIKPIQDACKGIVWHDDAQVVWGNVAKINSDKNYAVVIVEETAEDDMEYLRGIAEAVICRYEHGEGPDGECLASRAPMSEVLEELAG